MVLGVLLKDELDEEGLSALEHQLRLWQNFPRHVRTTATQSERFGIALSRHDVETSYLSRSEILRSDTNAFRDFMRLLMGRNTLR